MKIPKNTKEDQYNFFTSDWTEEEIESYFSTEAEINRISEEYKVDHGTATEYLNLLRMNRAEKFRLEEELETYKVHQAELIEELSIMERNLLMCKYIGGSVCALLIVFLVWKFLRRT